MLFLRLSSFREVVQTPENIERHSNSRLSRDRIIRARDKMAQPGGMAVKKLFFSSVVSYHQKDHSTHVGPVYGHRRKNRIVFKKGI